MLLFTKTTVMFELRMVTIFVSVSGGNMATVSCEFSSESVEMSQSKHGVYHVRRTVAASVCGSICTTSEHRYSPLVVIHDSMVSIRFLPKRRSTHTAAAEGGSPT